MDMTMCMNDRCEDRRECLRFTATPEEPFQDYSYFICEDRDYFFIPNKTMQRRNYDENTTRNN